MSALTINSVWMAVAVDGDGNEGVCAALVGGMWMPLLAADRDRLPWLLEQAELLAGAQDRPVRVIRLTTREEVDLLFGKGTTQ